MAGGSLVRTHGWGGNVPSSDDEAIARILAATREVVAIRGADTGIADVARALGVTRQTIYRYFPGTEALLNATGLQASGEFLDRIAAHLRGNRDPGAAVVEGIAYTIEQLPQETYVSLLLNSGRVAAFTAAVTSDIALEFGRSVLDRFDVDWHAEGLADEELTELAEMMLRTVQSFIVDPGRPPRDGTALRRYLSRWVAGGLPRRMVEPSS
jgi:AcrR family transcriptional regulator